MQELNIVYKNIKELKPYKKERKEASKRTGRTNSKQYKRVWFYTACYY